MLSSCFFSQDIVLQVRIPQLAITDLMVLMGIVLVLNGNYNGVYWYVIDSIGGMLNFVMVLLGKANGSIMVL